MSNVQLGYTQVIDPISFKSIPSGKIYIGEYGTLPNPANAGTWKQAYFVNSDGTRTAASQPIATNAAGYAVDGSGNIKSVQVDGKYSILVQSALGATKFSAAKSATLASSDQVDAGGGMTQSDLNLETTRKISAYVVPEQFGDTSTPTGTAAAFNAAAAYCIANKSTLVAGANAYTLGADVNLRTVRCDFSNCTITVNNGFLLTIGGNAGTSINVAQTFGVIKTPQSFSTNIANYPTACVRCIGAKGSTIIIEHVDRIQFYMSTNPATFPADASQSYNKIFINFVAVIDIDTDPAYAGGPNVDGPSSANQWFTENQFFLGRCMAFYMRGSYRHNNNRIHGGSFEDAVIDIQSGNKNWFTDCRLESTNTITFGTNTQGNIIEFAWYSSESYAYDNKPSLTTITDNGLLNIVKNVRNPYVAVDDVFLVSAFDKINNGQVSAYSFRAATRKAIRAQTRTTSRILSESQFVDTEKGDYFFASVESLTGFTSSYILRIYLYDKDYQLITPVSGDIDTGSFTSIFSDRFEGRVTSSSGSNRVGIVNSSVRFVKFQLLNSTSTSEDNGKYIKVSRISRNASRTRVKPVNPTLLNSFDFVTSAPTQFVGQMGDTVRGFANDYTCVFYLPTTITNTVSSSSIQLAATTVSGVSATTVGDLIGIDLDDGTTHWTTISSVGGGNIGLTAALPSTASNGNSVYVSRLVAR